MEQVRKKVLVLIDWYLPGFRAGGPIRSCANLIDHLSSEIDFYVVTTDTDYMSKVPYDSIQTNEWNKQSDGSNIYYLSKNNCTAATLKKRIREREYDYYYLNGMFSWYFTWIPLQYISDKKKVIVATRGMLSPGALAIKSLKKKLFLRYVTFTGLFKQVVFQASSEREKADIEKIFPNHTIRIVPNLHRKVPSTPVNKTEKISGSVRFIQVARIAPEKNLLYALNVLQSVSGKIVFDYYGSVYDSSYAEQCKKIIKQMPAEVRVSHRGEAHPNNLLALMQGYHFLVLPSHGENFGHVILEALSVGVPVIISDRTPWQNLEKANAGWDISLHNPSAFKEVIEKCIAMDQKEYEKRSQGALDYANAFYSHSDNIALNRKLFS
jgi:glycosyltransferase involved in cell wall biosynthesis